jgi:beta-galactosidase
MVFPEKFLWGASSCGFQFEMGDPSHASLDANTDWFAWVHDKQNIEKKAVSGEFPEDGPNYWFLYKEDHKISSELGFNAYRIGVEWSRIFPKSTKELKVDIERSDDGKISDIHAEEGFMEKLEKLANNDALDHYRLMISDLKQRGIEPFVCLNHFTLPLWVHNPIVARNSKLKAGARGWLDEDSIVEFWKYAAYLAWKLGDLVDFWATFNEPGVVAESGYLLPEVAYFPPGVSNFSASKKVLANMVVAHARAYDAIKEWDKIKAEQKNASSAEVGVIQNVSPIVPFNPKLDSEASAFASHIHNEFFIEAVTEGWLDENLNGRREKDEIKNYLKNKADWIGVNYYTRNVIRHGRSILARMFAGIPFVPEIVNDYGNNCKPNSNSADGRPTSDFGWELYPEGLTDALKLISKYGKPMYVTENGIADAEDKLRPQFITEHLKELDKAINVDKLNVKGYFHWALTDNYEWDSGFKMKFGLCAIDFKIKARAPRKSTEIYKRIIETKEVP